MPLMKAKDKTKKSLNKAVSYNIHELSGTGRPMKQVQAIAFAEARGGKPRYKIAKKK